MTPTPSTLRRSDRPKVLVVDDQPLNIKLLYEILRNDFEVFMAEDGLQAIAKSKALHPDLILLDIVMPGANGYEVCKELKSMPETADIPIIFVTSHSNELEEVHGFQVGAADFIHKPINPIITKARINNHIAIKKQREMLRSMALLDGLTGIANRRKFEEELHTLWLNGARAKTPLSVLIIDVDMFKQYNDHYGHVFGDQCLQIVARTIKNTLKRPCDLAARYGGEEFACILPNSGVDGSIHIAEMIFNNIKNLKIKHISSSVDQLLTVSIGIACCVPNADKSPSLLVAAADQQLYLSKRQGRARINSITL